MAIRKKRKDAQVGNIKSMPSKVKKKYRKNTKLKTVLEKEKVTSLHQLDKKYKKKKKTSKKASSKKKTVKKKKPWYQFW